MKTKAAVAYEAGKPMEIVELDLDGPRDGEVLIRYLYAGLCHSDVHISHGDLPARLPASRASSLPAWSPRRSCLTRSTRSASGQLKLYELITRTDTLEEANQGYDELLDGKNLRGVLVHQH